MGFRIFQMAALVGSWEGLESNVMGKPLEKVSEAGRVG